MTKNQRLPIIKALRKKYPHGDTTFNQKANKILECVDKINLLHSKKVFCDKWGNEVKIGDNVKWTVHPFPVGTVEMIDRDYVYTEHGRWYWSRIEVVKNVDNDNQTTAD